MTSYLIIGIWLIIAVSIVCLLSWEIIYAEGLWYLKAISSGLVVALIFYSIYTWQSIQGSPKFLSNAEGLIVRSYLIREPKNNKGKIWLWVTDPTKKEEPYNIEIPYTKETHKNLMGNKGLAEGRAQMMKKKAPSGSTDSGDGGYTFEDIIKFIPKEDSN